MTTIAGLFPILTETSFQAQILIPMAATLVYGLIVATVLVLLVVPTLFAVYWRLTHWQSPDVTEVQISAPKRLPVAVEQALETVVPDRP